MINTSHSPTFYPAKLLEYNAKERTAMIEMKGLTDGIPKGIPAMLAYPIGDDDLDTERLLEKGADIWVFFEQGDTTKPIIAFYRRHGKKKAVVGIRRIRNKIIELLATQAIKLFAPKLISINSDGSINIKAENINIDGAVSINGDITHTGSQTSSGDVVASGISVSQHTHIGNKGRPTSTPN